MKQNIGQIEAYRTYRVVSCDEVWFPRGSLAAAPILGFFPEFIRQGPNSWLVNSSFSLVDWRFYVNTTPLRGSLLQSEAVICYLAITQSWVIKHFKLGLSIWQAFDRLRISQVSWSHQMDYKFGYCIHLGLPSWQLCRSVCTCVCVRVSSIFSAYVYVSVGVCVCVCVQVLVCVCVTGRLFTVPILNAAVQTQIFLMFCRRYPLFLRGNHSVHRPFSNWPIGHLKVFSQT